MNDWTGMRVRRTARSGDSRVERRMLEKIVDLWLLYIQPWQQESITQRAEGKKASSNTPGRSIVTVL